MWGRFQPKLKGSTARQANQSLGRTVPSPGVELARVWRIENHIVQNPVQAGLVQSAEEYAWSSASKCGGLKPAAG